MLDNHIYNLMMQIVQEHTSLWRIKNEYLQDATKHNDNVTFWQNLAQEKETHITEMLALLKKQLDN